MFELQVAQHFVGLGRVAAQREKKEFILFGMMKLIEKSGDKI